jgi:hypothetical protein
MPAYSIRFDQRNSTDTSYTEVFISGSGLILSTDQNGVLTGSKTTNVSSSYSYSSSVAVSSSFSATSSFTQTSSYAAFSDTSSIAINSTFASTASSINFQIATASFATSSITSSYFNGNSLSTNNLTTNTASISFIFLNNTNNTPSSSFDSGTQGEMRLDANFVYFYVNNKWHRIPHSIWN